MALDAAQALAQQRDEVQAEALRRLPAATIADLTRSGFTELLVPARYGGREAAFSEILDPVRRMAHGCTSSAWTIGFYALHNWMLALFPEEAQSEAFSSRPFLAPAPLAPTGRGLPEAGGVRLSGRWSWAKQTYGHYITQSAQTVGEFASSAANRNNQHMSVFPTKKFVSSPWTVVAALGAVVAQHLQSAPELSRPLQTLVLEGIIGPRSRGDQLSRSDRQSLYFYGVSGYHMRRDGTVAIDRIVTTYCTNAWGNPDWTYLDIETMAQSMFTIRYLRTYITNMFPRVALARENPDNNGAVVTPRDIRNAVVHAYSDLVSQGVMENPSAFADSLIVEINANDPTRVDVDLKLDHVNQLRIVATLAVNYLQRQNTALAA